AEKAEDREGEPTARLEVGAGAPDHAVEDLPAVDAAVVGGGERIVAVAPGRRRHLGRVRADEVEALAGDGCVAVAEPRVDRDAVVRHYAVYTARMSAWAFAALARIAKLIASRTSSSVAPARLAPARSRFAQWVLPTARFAAR